MCFKLGGGQVFTHIGYYTVVEWDEEYWCIQYEATGKKNKKQQNNLLIKHKADLSGKKQLDVNMFVMRKCFHSDLTEENTSWLVLWPQEFTQHFSMQSDVLIPVAMR